MSTAAQRAAWPRPLPALAAAAMSRPALAAAGRGAAPVALAAVAAVLLPTTVLLSLRPRPGGLAWVPGLACAALLPLAVVQAQGHDLRVALTGTLLAVAGLQACRLPGLRELGVAAGVQLAVVASTLSQLTGPRASLAAWALVLAWGAIVATAVAVLLPGATAARGVTDQPGATGSPGAPPFARPSRPDRRLLPALVATALVALLAWSLLPQPSGSREAQGASRGGASRGLGADPDVGGGGQARVGLDGSDRLDLRARGATSPREVLLAHSSAGPGLWRAQVFDGYDGSGWSRGAGATSTSDGTRHDVSGSPGAAVAGGTGETTRLTVALLAPQDTVLAAGRALTVLLPRPVTVDGFGDVSAGTLPPGTTYTVQGAAPASAPDAEVPASPTEATRWLDLPAELPPRVRDLARTWAGGAGPAEAADRIAARLRATMTYRLDSPVPPRGRDAVDHLLFDAHSGFCEQFASAQAVLLRSLGVPARLVSGYSAGAGGQDPASTGTAGAPADGSIVVRDSDAHAWVQLWVPGRGWVDSDPTAGVPLASGADAPSRLPLLRALQHLSTLALVLLAVGLVVLVAAAVALVLVRRRHRRRRVAGGLADGDPRGPGTSYGPVAVAFAALEDALRAAGQPRRPQETPAEVLLRVPGGWPARGDVLPALEREVWGPGAPTPQQAGGAVDALTRLAATVRLQAQESASRSAASRRAR